MQERSQQHQQRFLVGGAASTGDTASAPGASAGTLVKSGGQQGPSGAGEGDGLGELDKDWGTCSTRHFSGTRYDMLIQL